MAVKNYQELVAWQKAMDLVEAVYKVSEKFPKEEVFGLRAQLRRSSVSIPSNIAEGQGRAGAVEFCRFLHIAHGSLREVETQLLIAQRLGYLKPDECKDVLAL